MPTLGLGLTQVGRRVRRGDGRDANIVGEASDEGQSFLAPAGFCETPCRMSSSPIGDNRGALLPKATDTGMQSVPRPQITRRFLTKTGAGGRSC